MNVVKLIGLGLLLFSLTLGQAQSTYKDLGKDIQPLTLSGGKYDESFDEDSVVQIGTVLFNTNTGKIVAFVEQDTLRSEATLEPQIVSKWLSPDPAAAKFPFSSPYVYADNPGKKVLTADNILHLTWNVYRKDIDYKPTTYSQAEENSIWHSMRSNSEADTWGMSAEKAKASGQAFGWYNIFSQEKELDYGKLGQGIHALEDAVAHQGAKTNDHLGRNWSSIKMFYNDLYGNTERAETFANSAVVTFGLLRNEKVNIGLGQKFTTEGMSSEQSSKIMGLLDKSGYAALPIEGSKTDYSLYLKNALPKKQ